MKTELQVILEERRLRTENSPAGKIEEALWGLAYSRHPYRWPVIGYAKDLMSLSARDLMKFYQANYQPGNAIVVIVGNFDPNETFKKIENYYGPISGHVRPERDVIVEGCGRK
jgi:zinc protease